MIFPYASLGVEYATRLTEPLFDAPAAEPASSATPIKAMQMIFIPTPYLPTLSTEVMEIDKDSGRRQIGTGAALESALVEPIERATIWPYRDGEPGELYYQRYAHPNALAVERQLGELEGGEALVFPSGAGATTALVLALLEPGQMIALAAGAYYGTGVLFSALERWGLRHVEFDQKGPPPDGVDLVWLEAPSNPSLEVPDLDAGVAPPARVLVDSTAATPVYLRPLESGTDFALHSATKSLGGPHARLLGGVACRP